MANRSLATPTTLATQAGRKRVLCGLIIGLIAPLLVVPVSATKPRYQVELFTTADYPPPTVNSAKEQDVQLTVYYLDGLVRLNATLSHQLPPQPAAATAIAAARLGVLTDSDHAQLRSTATGLLAAQRYGLTRYPAIVVNGVAVTYGLTDSAEAVRRYQVWRGESRP